MSELAKLEPGTYPNVRFTDYLGWGLPSQTTLKAMLQSPAHYRATMQGERVKVPTDDMTLGSALHTAFLEPELTLEHVAVWRGASRRGAAWDAFCEEHAGKYLLTEAAYGRMQGMVRALRAHPFVREWQSKMQGVEVAAVGDVYGLRMKGRVDALTEDPPVDLKKCRSCDERTIVQTIMRFGYHIQADVYRNLFGKERFVLLMVEDEEPFDVVPVELAPAFLRCGEERTKRLVEKVLECQAADEWPGRSQDARPVQVEPPEWAFEGLESGVEYGDEDEDWRL